MINGCTYKCVDNARVATFANRPPQAARMKDGHFWGASGDPASYKSEELPALRFNRVCFFPRWKRLVRYNQLITLSQFLVSEYRSHIISHLHRPFGGILDSGSTVHFTLHGNYVSGIVCTSASQTLPAKCVSVDSFSLVLLNAILCSTKRAPLATESCKLYSAENYRTSNMLCGREITQLWNAHSYSFFACGICESRLNPHKDTVELWSFA